MKKENDFPTWAENNRGVIFFAQAIEEMLFHHAHDSLKAPALNFPFLCVEMVLTIRRMFNEELRDKGYFPALFQELQTSFDTDKVAQSVFGSNFFALFSMKDENGNFITLTKNAYEKQHVNSDKFTKHVGKVCDLLSNEIMMNKYYNALVAEITNHVKSFDDSRADDLYALTRSFVTYLINTSYCQEFIYSLVSFFFFNKSKKNNNGLGQFEKFIAEFDYKPKQYKVIFPFDGKHADYLKKFKSITIADNTKEDGKAFFPCNSTIPNVQKVLIFELKKDGTVFNPFDAKQDALEYIKSFYSFVDYVCHDGTRFSPQSAIVVDLSNKKTYELNEPICPLRRGSERHNDIERRISEIFKHFEALGLKRVVGAMELHSSALVTNSMDNQLLNLWTIIEIMIPTEQPNGFAKINQFCNALTSVLTIKYLPSLFNQYFNDIKHHVLGSKATAKKTYLLKLLTLPDETDYKKLLTVINGNPLLVQRTKRYRKLFSDKQNILKLIESHKNRLNWHIRRIYRHRNLIAHNGSDNSSYKTIILQNLHFYVDTLIDTLFEYAPKNDPDIEHIFLSIQTDERLYLSLLKDTTPWDDKNFEKILCCL
ncbi:MAG: hypothetical protein FWE38_03450 [Firmicutes bacterium]|nr:hypothetical protein [Bacillota bacterium]